MSSSRHSERRAIVVSCIHAITGGNEEIFRAYGLEELNRMLADGWNVVSSTPLGGGHSSTIRKSETKDFHHEVYAGAGCLIILAK